MSVVRVIVGWLTPLAILAAGIAAFMFLGQQSPPDRKQVEGPAATPVRAVEAVRETGGLVIELDGDCVLFTAINNAGNLAGVAQAAARTRALQFARLRNDF